MTVNDVTIQVERTKSYAPSRRPTRRTIAIGATASVAAIVALATVVRSSDHPTSEPAVRAASTLDARAITIDLVNRGLIPRQTLQPAPQSAAAITIDLANRGLIPRQTLQPAPQSAAAIVRDLANRGLIPRQTLEPAPRSIDDIVRDLVNRGLVPSATLDD